MAEERSTVGQSIAFAIAALGVGTGLLAHATPDAARVLSPGDLDDARAASHDAYLATLQALDWRSALELGHTQMRLAIAAGFPELGTPGARAHYREALRRARRARSAEGVARATAALTLVDGLAPADDARPAITPREAPATPRP